MKRLLPLLFALLIVAAPAHAKDAPEESPPSAFDKLDAKFGEWFVGPVASVMFWDIAFWDNTLPLGSQVGEVIGEEKVVSYTKADGYTFQKVLEIDREGAIIELTEPRVESHGDVKISYVNAAQHYRATIRPGPVKVGVDLTPIAEVDPATLGTLDPAEPGAARFVLQSRGPFPVVVQANDPANVTAGFTVVRAVHTAPANTFDIGVGATVRSGDKVGQVEAVNDNSYAVLGETRRSGEALANPDNIGLPIVVVWLVVGAVFFTLRMQFISIRGFGHAIMVTTGRYDKEDDPGEVSHFQALSAALSATVGLGNIAGVAIAVAVGGPGAIFWMVVAGFLGMSSKFAECTLGQMYRVTDSKGNVSGGPMRYLDAGLRELGMGPLGKVLAVVFAVMCIGGSLGGGNMFQANQSFAAVSQVVPMFEGRAWLYGLVLAIFVGVVIIGGIRSIGKVAGFIVPLMCGVYVAAAIYILVVNADQVGAAFGTIIGEAFSPEAGKGGLLGVLIQGFRRAAFSNEAGVGSASIAHSAASTDEPVREGIVALLEPFIDTIIVCTMTGLVVVITGAYQQDTGDGVLMTSAAFGSVIEWFPLILSFAVVMFAFSTMISWSYYGERCATYLFGEAASLPYKIVFLVCVFAGSVFKLGNVLDFSDLMILGMAFPNILGVALLSGKVKAALDDYWGRYKSGAMKPH